MNCTLRAIVIVFSIWFSLSGCSKRDVVIAQTAQQGASTAVLLQTELNQYITGTNVDINARKEFVNASLISTLREQRDGLMLFNSLVQSEFKKINSFVKERKKKRQEFEKKLVDASNRVADINKNKIILDTKNISALSKTFSELSDELGTVESIKFLLEFNKEVKERIEQLDSVETVE